MTLLDQQPSAEVRELLTRLPLGWQAWSGVSGLLYARRPKSSPPIVVRGGTVDEVVEKAHAALSSGDD